MMHKRNTNVFFAAMTCTLIAGILFPFSLWLTQTERKGMGGIISEIYGSGGFLLTSIVSLIGVVCSILSLKKTKQTNEPCLRLRRYSAGTLVLCALLLFVSLISFLKQEF